jgi:hypothetical protein
MSIPYDPSPTVTYENRSSASVGELLADVSRDFSTLMRQEVELAKAEVKESATKAGKGVGMFAGAGVGGHLVLLFLSIALWWGLGDATGHAISALIVAAVWAVIAAVLAVMGRTALKTTPGLTRTAETVKKIPPAVKGDA